MTSVVVCNDPVTIAESADVLDRIRDPQVHLALWARGLPDALAGLAALEWDGIDDIDAAVAVEALAFDVPTLLEEAGYGDMTPALSHEIVMLGARLSAIMGCEALRLRLEVIETDACRRFHVDNVAARLLMPLVGPGTQWRRADAESPIHELGRGEVGVFKGHLWAAEPRILHRSPPIAATGETRLLLALNPYADGEMVG